MTDTVRSIDSLDRGRPDAAPSGIRVSADQIADALGRFRPTPQQRAVIEAPMDPVLVIAGAGSGKTETMANRVLWLLANSMVRPGEILGMTFTRKAAGELSQRIGERIAELRSAGLMPQGLDDFEIPTVATYNSFANLIYRDNAILLGRESDGAVLGEAAAWQLARSSVIRSTDDRLPDLGKSLERVTAAVLDVSRALAENVADREAVRRYAQRFTGIAELPPGSNRGRFEGVADLADAVGSLDVLVDLAAGFEAAKFRRGVVEYSDQVALALAIVVTRPEVAADLRQRFAVVLLDEYQDTSVVQTELLAEVFGGQAVMAVGDPNQSIYGWRGASSANLEQFPAQFGRGGSATTFALSTSWRNGRRILDVANRLVEPFTHSARVRVERLDPSRVASDREVSVEFHETVVDEAAATADWLAERLDERGSDGSVPSAAMLFRTRKTQPYFLEAMRQRGIRFHVLGVGGILAEPEIADLVSALSVIDDPAAGIELVRLLAGSRWRVGVQDLHALSRLASWLRDRDLHQQRLDDEVKQRMRASTAEGDGASIVDALDFLGTAKPDHSALHAFSADGLDRLRDAARFFARMRARTGLDLPDLVTLVEQSLQLDVEIAANGYRPLGMANIEALYDALDGYLAIAESATLGGFLSWLREAEQREDLTPRPEDPEPGTVQVLTVHGSKGLEWDAVAVPRMVEDELPARPQEGFKGWLSFGRMPWPFRGDAADLPEFEWETAATRKEIVDEEKRFSAAVRARSVNEERRLAYVAVTRARHSLLLSGSFWATQSKPRSPSRFLTELADSGVIASLPAGPADDANPLGDDLEMMTWPVDPLGSRRSAVEAAAEAVRSASPAVVGPWARDVQLLLAERAAKTSAVQVAVPDRIPASRFKDFVTQPDAVAARLRRPMPERPYRATRLGTLFHSWVEERYGTPGVTDLIDAGDDELDVEQSAIDREALDALQRTFEQSPWAALQPVDVEREVHLPLAGQVIVCKIDAVYSLGGEGDRERFQVVDWKTGKAPTGAADLEEKQLQLALYRLAYARWRDIEPERIDAVFYYVADDAVITPARIFDEAELTTLWREAFG